MKLLDVVAQYFRKFGLMAPLNFDRQVWGAKSLMDLVQDGSKFLIAEGTAGQSTYTCWLGSRDNVATAIVIDATGRATGPFPDDSKTKDCVPWVYPPKVTCVQAVSNLAKSGITEAWVTCTLKKVTGQKNPAYTFTFGEHAPVTVDATTGKII